MKVLVLGGAGYIGSHTVRALIETGARVAVADNLQTGHREAVHPAAHFYAGDIRDRAFLEDLFGREPVDVVIHFAASSLVPESMTDPLKYYDNNVNGTRVLLSAMAAGGIENIVFSSSAAVYGEPEQTPVPEDAPACPTNPYGETKLAMEKMFYWAARAHKLRYVSLRYFNACGADKNGVIGEAHSPETHLIPLVLEAAAGRRDSIRIYGTDYPTPDGTCLRDYIHVSDLAEAHIAAAKYLLAGKESSVFNLGSGRGYSVQEIVNAAEKVTNRPIRRQLSPRRPGDPARLIASSEKAKALLGWEPRITSMEYIIETAWRWHQAHPRGYEA